MSMQGSALSHLEPNSHGRECAKSFRTKLGSLVRGPLGSMNLWIESKLGLHVPGPMAVAYEGVGQRSNGSR